MGEHICQHEGDIAIIKQSMEQNTATTEKIFDLLNGNGRPGIKTEIALLKQSDNRSRWWLRIITAGLFGITMKLIYTALT